MKGLNKRIIEITDPESETIDRVIVVLKPGLGRLTTEKRAEITAYVAGLRPRARGKKTVLIAVGAAALLAALFFGLQAAFGAGALQLCVTAMNML